MTRMMAIGKMISLVMSWVGGFAPSPSIPDSHSPITSDDRDHDCNADDDADDGHGDADDDDEQGYQWLWWL